MMVLEQSVDDRGLPSLSSPPGMTASKSSKSSSFNSLNSDDASVLADASHFEDIGLEEEANYDARHVSEPQTLKSAPNPYGPNFSSDLRSVAHKQLPSSTPRLLYSRELSSKLKPRDGASVRKSRPPFPSLKSQIRQAGGRSNSLGPVAVAHAGALPIRNFANRSVNSLSLPRHRSPSPNLSLSPRDPNLVLKPRRSSWQSTSDKRKSTVELELECDEDDGDDIPDGLILDNVPISPRPPQERAKSQPVSKAASPERPAKEKTRSVGNGTPAVAVAQGSLRSPSWKSDTAIPTLKSASSNGSTLASSPIKSRAKSWTAALADLSEEAKALTVKLEEHADTLDLKSQRSSTGSLPSPSRSASNPYAEPKPRVKSAIAELPPLRRTDIMIDPLPISKEKEAVLSRTRPSWLPPKDPAEEKRHLKQYQKMMALSAEADRRRDAARKARSECRDTAAVSIMRIWEDEILPRWGDAIRERRTRELWWRGIAPRSRGLVWTRAIGNELGLSDTSYSAALSRAHEVQDRIAGGRATQDDMRHADCFAAIRQDVEEQTWKELKIFQAGAPLHDNLIDVLCAYAMYRSDIGYVAGCNTIAALLLLNFPTTTATFIALANVLNRPMPLSFYTGDPGAKSSAYNLLLQTLAHKSPALHAHLVRLPDHDPDEYFNGLLVTLFTGYLSFDEAARLWDVYVFEGDTLLIRAAVAFIMDVEMRLLSARNMEEVRDILSKRGSKGEESEIPVAIASNSAEEKWIKAVREAGKV